MEDVNGARIIDPESGASTGRIRGLTTGEVEGAWFEKVGDTYRFTFPAGRTCELEIADEGTATVLFAAPGDGDSGIIHSIYRTDAAEEGLVTVSRHPLPVSGAD